MGKFLSTLAVEQVNPDQGTWRLTQPLSFHSIFAGVLTVPAGFVTDFASVPRIPIIFDVLGDKGQAAATLHDWLYAKPHPLETRERADEVLKEALIAQGMDDAEASLMFLGVRLGGESHYE
jgi:hypothetical protein